jgi:hypothetical protein
MCLPVLARSAFSMRMLGESNKEILGRRMEGRQVVDDHACGGCGTGLRNVDFDAFLYGMHLVRHIGSYFGLMLLGEAIGSLYSRNGFG